ncbi:hypothetical protein CMI47_21910 [Candidatus Pacearchaeota archaeon]|nr:hypothetical protein [Candidatus Pacearchaeota archaeon]|tara:strand:+ start:2063 stop:2371 length:309 start_codon:yes stop_codon:yes gene_type:complete
MKITKSQLRSIIKEELTVEFFGRTTEKETTEKDRLESLVADDPARRALGESQVQGSLQMARDLAQHNARVKLSDMTGESKISARQIDGALVDNTFYVVMELR